jgi:hypothetical protein
MKNRPQREKRPPILPHRRRRQGVKADLLPADPVVTQLFADLQLARAVANRDQHRAQHFERRAWSYLMQYLTTLECPNLLEPQ